MANSEGWDIRAGPGLTALGLAASRAVETGCQDALIDDPFGPAFLEAVNSPVEFPTHWPAPGTTVSDTEALHLHGSRFIGLRTRWYDDVVLDAGPSVPQVILLASGLDMRAFRLGLPDGTRVFDLDQPQVVAFKRSVVEARAFTPRAEWLPVGTDLRGDWPSELRAAGFAPDQPTVWIAEGLLAYLPVDAQAQLFERIDRLTSSGGRLAFDFLSGVDRLAEGGRLAEVSRRSGVDMSSLVDQERRPDPASVLANAGWDVTVHTADRLAARYDRNLASPLPGRETDAAPWLTTTFVEAWR